ncbi:predicted protein [Sclerotinia sclerotiorum 1980 UF-70]|uniref:Uncharacterized protein n=1 Tax=Sclerotinia sclerotiorum (strain ATCC 18683 / 1980 / Ss-1) TaxID=665079 RepID=A7F3X3_SCLS1|nr:predicted protein [Sclerotinia sclerotiorum 1980 UF-70]EDN97444.1 predicted protein [Sclerotinia sclerotiorum 1980 UF-70]
MSNTSDTSADAGVLSGETEPKVSGRKTIQWFACIFVLIIVVLVTGNKLTSSHENIPYQPSGSPCFAKAALEQLLQSENIASDRSEDFFGAIDKAKTKLSIDIERKTSEIEKIASSLEETIQSSPDPKEWWWEQLATTAKKESFAKNQLEYMKSLYRAHEDTTKSTISQVPQLGHTADKAHVELNESVHQVMEKIQYERRVQTSNLNEVLLDITTKDAFLQRYQSQLRYLGTMRFSQISEYQAGREGRKKSKKSYEISLELLEELERTCLNLRAERDNLQKEIAHCTAG